MEYGVRWVEYVGHQGSRTTKEKFFTTDKALTRFIVKLEAKDSFGEILATTYPRTKQGTEGHSEPTN